jgi:hypothetical protein
MNEGLQVQYPHWEYFLGLVDDVERLSRFIELSEDNFETYSTECTRILLSAGSEVDVVAKVLCNRVSPGSNARNFEENGKTLLPLYPGIPAVDVTMKRSRLSFRPWSDWTSEARPAWWKSYNEVKHRRHDSFKDANVGNVLNAVAGLCVLVTYLYYDELIRTMLPMYRPSVFVDKQYNVSGGRLLAVGVQLPDFPG